MKKLILNPNEMAIRKIYWPLIIKGRVTTFFRPGVRLCAAYRGYCEKQVITLKKIEHLGSDRLGIAPQFDESEEIIASIEHIYSKKIGELNRSDFEGSSPDVYDSNVLKFHLGLIYNLSLDELTDDFHVTIIRLNYNDSKSMTVPKKQLENLAQNGLWQIAKLPPVNPKSFSNQGMMVTLINHDYPARTPLLWNSAFTHFNVAAKSLVLVPRTDDLEKENLKWTLEVFRDDNRFLAGGLGVGFKDEAIELLDLLDDSAANVGAANFILKNDKGLLIGYNTDGTGFVQGLQENFPSLNQMTEKKVLLLGSGGTANAIAFALAKAGAHLIVANRTESKAVALAEKINDFYQLSGEAKAIGCQERQVENYFSSLDLIVNASIKGATGEWENYSSLAVTDQGLEENLKISQKLLTQMSKTCIIADIILRSDDTPLISQAKKLKLQTMDGLPMVVSQAALAFFLSYGKKLGLEFSQIYKVMKDAIK